MLVYHRGNRQSLNVCKIGSLLLISGSQFSDRTRIFMESKLHTHFSVFKTMTFAQKLLALQVSNFFEAFIRRYAVLYMLTTEKTCCYGIHILFWVRALSLALSLSAQMKGKIY